MNKKIVVFLKIVVSLGLVVFLFDQVDFEKIVNILQNVNITIVIYSLILLIIQVFVATTRWFFVLKCQNIEISYGRVLQILWSGLFFNQAMPSSVGGDVIRGYYLKKQGITLGRATVGVLMDRLFGMLGLILLVLFSIPFVFELVNDSIARTGVLFITLGASFTLMFMFFTDKLPGNFSHLRIIKGFYALSKGARHCISNRFSGIIILILSLLLHIISVVAVMIISIGIGINIEWLGFLLIIPLVTLIMVVPVSIAGWGVREGAMVVGFSYLSVESEAALALSILYGLTILVVALPGGIIWAFKRSHTSRSAKSDSN